MDNVTSITTELLIQIRDAIGQTNARLDQTNTRLDHTIVHLEAAHTRTHERIDGLQVGLDRLREEMRQGFSDVKDAILDLDHVVVREAQSQRQLSDRLDELEVRVSDLEKKTG